MTPEQAARDLADQINGYFVAHGLTMMDRDLRDAVAAILSSALAQKDAEIERLNLVSPALRERAFQISELRAQLSTARSRIEEFEALLNLPRIRHAIEAEHFHRAMNDLPGVASAIKAQLAEKGANQ